MSEKPAIFRNQTFPVRRDTYKAHQYVRRDVLIRPFFWHGFWPAAGLVLLAWYGLRPFAVNEIEAMVRQGETSALESAGHPWASVSVSGQDVHLSGVEPRPGAGDEALRTARAAKCRSWLGRETCAVSVTGQFEPAPAPVPAPATAPTPAVSEAVRCEQSLADIARQNKIEFATASATIRASSEPVLSALATAARQCPGTLEVVGHTDGAGTAETNQRLSIARAEAVAAALVAHGFPRERVHAAGYGSTQPVATNETALGRSQNRRIEFHVTGIPGSEVAKQ